MCIRDSFMIPEKAAVRISAAADTETSSLLRFRWFFFVMKPILPYVFIAKLIITLKLCAWNKKKRHLKLKKSEIFTAMFGRP